MSYMFTEQDVDRIVSESMSDMEALTPVPDKLEIHWDWGANYWFDGVQDGSSLVWIPLMMLVFGKSIGGGDWLVDDPGTLYDQMWEDEDCEVSPYSMVEMQKAADVSLELYRAVFEKMVALGAPVEDE